MKNMKALSVFAAFAAFMACTPAMAANQPSSNRMLIAPNAKGVAVSCGVDSYNNKIASIRHFNGAEYAVSFGPLAVGGTILYLMARGGGGETGWAVGAPLGVMAIGGIDYGAIRLVKHIEAHHYVEVADNLGEALHTSAGDKALRHTTDLIDNMDPSGNWTTEQVSKALLEALKDGDLCDSKGNLDVTGKFRKVVLAHLKGESAADIAKINGSKAIPAAAQRSNAGVASSKPVESGAAPGAQTVAQAAPGVAVAGTPNAQ